MNMKRTAIVYDEFNQRHTLEGHPENRKRLQEVWNLLRLDGILQKVEHLPSAAAPMEAVLRVHERAYIDRLYAATLLGRGHLDADTYLTDDSYDAAFLAAGGLLNLVDAIMTGRADNGFALVRPPGHHAEMATGMGFCLLSNVAIAARWAQDRHGAERVLVIDFDVHHGNGTQDVFYEDPSVLLINTHQYPFYPGTGSANEIGAGRAPGSTINIPFPAMVGDAGYSAAFRQIVVPAAVRFKPDLILLSAGYDAHWMDPLANMRLSIGGYSRLVQMVVQLAEELCQGRLVCTLEGGYHLQVLAHSVLSTLRQLHASPQGASDPFGPAPGGEREVGSLLDQLVALHQLPAPPLHSLPV
jgi:acetoin utilization deacetylase AcuC-like enzyme